MLFPTPRPTACCPRADASLACPPASNYLVVRVCGLRLCLQPPSRSSPTSSWRPARRRSSSPAGCSSSRRAAGGSGGSSRWRARPSSTPTRSRASRSCPRLARRRGGAACGSSILQTLRAAPATPLRSPGRRRRSRSTSPPTRRRTGSRGCAPSPAAHRRRRATPAVSATSSCCGNGRSTVSPRSASRPPSPTTTAALATTPPHSTTFGAARPPAASTRRTQLPETRTALATTRRWTSCPASPGAATCCGACTRSTAS
mmetsp:Transcript_35137/g.117412  ORF Transcript_35137/g.117412 Transcript_35137/m.117412 type:complete len:258 (-) Transcript_35137:283-1056(-)